MLKAKLTRLADAPEGARDFYVKADDGTYRLQVETVEGFGLGEVETLKADGDRLWGALRHELRDAAIERVVTSAGGNLALLLPHFRERVDVDRQTLKVTVTKDGRKAHGPNGQPLKIDDLVEDFRKNETFSRAFEASAGEVTAPDKPKQNPWGSDLTLTDFMRETAAKRAKEQKQPIVPVTFNPLAPDFNLSKAMAYARGCPEREAELKKAMAGVKR